MKNLTHPHRTAQEDYRIKDKAIRSRQERAMQEALKQFGKNGVIRIIKKR